MTLGERIDGPQATPPRVGLLASVPVDVDTTEAWWGQGLHFRTESCADAGVFDICSSGVKSQSNSSSLIDATPFGVYATERCSTLGSGLNEFTERATRALLSKQSYAIEKELWEGNLAQANSYPNGWLTKAAPEPPPRGWVVGSGAFTPDDALAVLEYNLGQALDGSPGLIHAPRNIVSLWAKGGGLRREGSLIRTVNDTIVVPGSGYTGSAPGGADPGATGFAYGTDMMSVKLGPIRIIPEDESFARVDMETNTIEVRAERLAAIIWPFCADIGVEITAPFDS